MVWQNLSPIPVGRSGIISSFKWVLPVSATRRGRKRESAPCDPDPDSTFCKIKTGNFFISVEKANFAHGRFDSFHYLYTGIQYCRRKLLLVIVTVQGRREVWTLNLHCSPILMKRCHHYTGKGHQFSLKSEWMFMQRCETVTIYFLRFRFRFRLLKSYGSGSGSNFWKVMVPVSVPVHTFEKLRFRFWFWKYFCLFT